MFLFATETGAGLVAYVTELTRIAKGGSGRASSEAGENAVGANE